jgi:hypothetical protein
MSGIMNMFVAAKTTVAAAVDEFFNRVTLLLNTSSTNGAQNNTFLDSSSNAFSITRNGNTTQGTFTPFSQTGWSNFFDGTDDYLAIADNSVLRAGTSNFTLEAWIWRNASGAAHTIYAKGGASTGIVFQVTSTNVLRFTHTTTNIDSTGTIAANSWNHVAVVREGTGTNQTKLYINGTQDGQGTVSTDFTQTEEVRIGTDRSAASDFNGYISNLRFVKGTALYTTTFTPSTTPLTTTSQGATSTEVELLTCQNNRFLDNSSNAFSITVTGTPSAQAFSPFAPTAEYSTSVVGGSGYFDGTGDYLTVANNTALQITNVDWTIESWMYLTTLPSASGYQAIAQKGRGNASDYEYFVAINNNAGNYRISVELSTTGSNVVGYNSSTITLRANTWNHFAVSKSGTTLYYFVNGVAAGTSTITSATGWYTGTGTLGIGGNNNGSAYLVFGYMSGTRITKSGALYTTAFTPPTAPPTTTVSAGTVSLLTNFTNAGIFDSTAKNVLETVGNAQVSTTQAKWDTTSMYFDGTGDYLLVPYNKRQDITQGDFTIEGWFYRGATGVEHNIINNRFTTGGCLWRINSGNTVSFTLLGQSTITSTGTISANTWTHIAVTRSGANVRIFINGTIDGSSSTYANGTASTTVLRIGSDENLTNVFNGYMDDLRITNGYARYTANFTAPTAAFPLQ